MKLKCKIRKGGNWCPLEKRKCVDDNCISFIKREERREKLQKDMEKAEKMIVKILEEEDGNFGVNEI